MKPNKFLLIKLLAALLSGGMFVGCKSSNEDSNDNVVPPSSIEVQDKGMIKAQTLPEVEVSSLLPKKNPSPSNLTVEACYTPGEDSTSYPGSNMSFYENFKEAYYFPFSFSKHNEFEQALLKRLEGCLKLGIPPQNLLNYGLVDTLQYKYKKNYKVSFPKNPGHFS